MSSEIFQQKYNQLNEQQREAVDAIQGPVLVVAGPGTGKTQVLAVRIAAILQQPGVNPDNILCITFTEAGVAAMRKRLLSIIGKPAYQVHIHTFHGFCNEVIQTFPDKFVEFSKNPAQVTDLLRVKIMRGILDGLDPAKKYDLRPFHNPYTYLYEINQSIQVLKREGVSVEELEAVAAAECDLLEANPDLNKKTGKPTVKYQQAQKVAQRNVELAEIYAQYQQVLTEENYYDYEDMILLVLNKFGEDQELLAHYAEKFLYIHIDEYQDTNGAQNKLIKLLGSMDPDQAPNIFAVGDDDQAIYRFQGANVDNLLFFEQQFQQVKVIVIDKNYRSSQPILDFAEQVIGRNKNRLVNLMAGLQKRLQAAGQHQKLMELPRVGEFETEDAENAFIVGEIQSLIGSGVEPNKIAILYRRHADAESIIDALLRAGVPLQIAAGNNALQEREVQMLVNFLRVIAHQQPDLDRLLSEILFYDFLLKQFQIERVDVYKLLAYLGKQNYRAKLVEEEISLYEALGNTYLHQQLGLAASDALSSLQKSIAHWRSLSAEVGLAEAVVHILHESGLFGVLLDNQVDVDKLTAVRSFYNFVRAAQRLKPDITVRELLQDLKLLEENRITIPEPASGENVDSVQLMTAHSAKGLEYEHVFVIKAYRGNWGGKTQRQIIKLPHSLISLVEFSSKEEKVETFEEDERRLFFVAVTRAQKALTVTSARNYDSNGATKSVEQSSFLSEISQQMYENLTEIVADPKSVFAQQLTQLPKAELSKKEENYLKSLVAEFALSASSLNEYIACPLRFKFNRLLHIPQLPQVHIALGNAVHRALELHGRALMLGKEHSPQQVIADFKSALLTENLGREDYQRTLAEGERLLTDYLEHYAGESSIPAGVEYNFSRHNVALNLEGSDPIPLVGKIDKLEWVDQDTNRVKIIDYKTSSPKSENEIRGNTKYSEGEIWRQLVFYQLLANLDSNFRPQNKLQKYLVDHVEVDFIKPASNKNYRKVSFKITNEDVEELTAEIQKVVEHIRQLDFYGSEEFPLCGECEFCQAHSAY